MFGKGTELGEGEWRGVIRQLMAQGLLSVESQHQTFVLTEESRPVLRGERAVKLRRDPERPAKTRSRSSRAPQVELPPEAATVFERLRGVARSDREGAGRARLRDLPRRHPARGRDAAARRAWPSSARSAG